MIFGFLPQNLKTQGGGRGFHYVLARGRGRGRGGADRGMARLAGFRSGLYRSLGTRRDVLFEVADALACRPERVHMLAELCLEAECRRGHGGVYDAVNCGEVRIGRCAGQFPGSRRAGGRRADPAGVRREQLAAAGGGDEPGAAVLPLLRAGQGERVDDPGLAVLAGRGAGARPCVVDAAAGRGPAGAGDDATEVTASQVRDVIARLVAAGQWKPGDPDVYRRARFRL